MNWNELVQRATPYVLRIETPNGHGTGFIAFTTGEGRWCAIATAWHVIDTAKRWRQPIQIHQQERSVFLADSDRHIFHDADRDCAIVLVRAAGLEMPGDFIPLRPIEARLPIGMEVGWLGYPAVVSELCFFSGNVSAYQHRSYLLDGVAINGVSGGPVLYEDATDGLQIVGSMNAYIANRSTGAALPGLSVAQDVSTFIDVSATLKEVDERIAARAAAEAAKQQPADGASPSEGPSIEAPPPPPMSDLRRGIPVEPDGPTK